jgi:hypothetical protein
MKNLFEAASVEEVQARMAQLRPESERQWGTMHPAQALAHCAGAMEWALGDRIPARMWLGQIMGRLVKPMVFGNDDADAPEFADGEGSGGAGCTGSGNGRARLHGLIDRFAAAGPAGCTTHPHSFFGRPTPEEWATLMYKHLDHHLRQFRAECQGCAHGVLSNNSINRLPSGIQISSSMRGARRLDRSSLFQ